jgi:tripartite-type tricarboxylate transporter receptor subunit TctC
MLWCDPVFRKRAVRRSKAMKLPQRRFLHRASGVAAFLVFCISLLAVTGPGAWSQTTKVIKIVVPFAPGGGLDILARLLAEQIGRAQGPTMVIENRPGAGTVIGTEAASRALPDGNTVLLNTPNLVISPHLRKLNYDPLTSFESICNLATTPTVIVVNGASPYRTLADLINAARAQPGVLTLASGGSANVLHLAFEMFKRVANVSMTYVPYPGTAPAIGGLMGEHVTSAFSEYPTVAEQLKTGKLRALATLSHMRIETLPDLPTVAESGYKDYEVELWYGLFAPAKTPKETVSQLAGLFTAALRVPDVKAKLAVQGLYPVGTCGAEFGAYIRKQYDDYGRVIREANIKAE